MSRRFGYYIHAIMHPIDQIDVGKADRSEHNFRAASATTRRVRRQIVRSKVRFRFHDPTDIMRAVFEMDQMFAQQFLRDRDGVTIIKLAWQFVH